MVLQLDVIMVDPMFLVHMTSMFCSWASAVSSPVLRMELRVRQLKVETRVVFLHLKSRQSFKIFWPVAFFSIAAWHPTGRRAPWWPARRAMWYEEVVELLVMLFFNCFHTSTSPGGVLPYMGYIGTCRGIGYGFWGSRSLNRVSFLTFVSVSLVWSLDRVA